MSKDPLWPSAASWLKPASEGSFDLGLFGVLACETSISATGANTTPAEIRVALARYSTYSWSQDKDLRDLSFADFGDSETPDSPEGENQTMALARKVSENSKLSIAIGGDNSITYAVMRGVFGEELSSAGLITFDAHHDLRDGVSNGSPVRRLIDAGLPGTSVVQIGINDFSNSPQYAARAREYDVQVIPRASLRNRTADSVMDEALSKLGNKKLHVDIDMDVCDRAFVPACPAAAPGGISADELRQFAFLVGKAAQVVSVDITEIDALADSADGRTVRLGALTVLELANGLDSR